MYLLFFPGTTTAEDLVPTLLSMYDTLVGHTREAVSSVDPPRPSAPPPPPPPAATVTRPLSVTSIASSSSSSSSSGEWSLIFIVVDFKKKAFLTGGIQVLEYSNCLSVLSSSYNLKFLKSR